MKAFTLFKAFTVGMAVNAAIAAGMYFLTSDAHSQVDKFLSQPVTLVVPNKPGGAVDIQAGVAMLATMFVAISVAPGLPANSHREASGATSD